MPKKHYNSWVYLNAEGKKLWGDVFPDGIVPVRSLLSQVAKLEGAGDERVFLVDWEHLTGEEQNAVLERLSKKTGAVKDVILEDILKKGLPLREKYTNGAGTSLGPRFF